jgi:tetratricopeptide (TPR) repeat protein
LDNTNIDADFILAICYNDLHQYEQALGAAKSFLEQVPNNQEILLVYATSNFNLHNYEKALDIFAEMSEEAQQSLIVLKAKGMSFYNLERYSEAVEVLKQAPLRIRNLTPALVEIHYWLARALEALGKKKDAIKHYEKISVVRFDFEDVQERLNSLGKKES